MVDSSDGAQLKQQDANTKGTSENSLTPPSSTRFPLSTSASVPTGVRSVKREDVDNPSGDALEEGGSQSDTANSIPVINLPDDIKNDDVKPVCFDDVVRGGVSVNRSCGGVSSPVVHDMLSTTRTISMMAANGGSVTVEVPLLFSIIHETQPTLSEFLFELKHVSECFVTTGHCRYSWCADVKRDVFHASICTNTNCNQCMVLRPLLLIHSIQCPRANCSLPFCAVAVSLPIYA